MSLTLHVDRQRWDAHVRGFVAGAGVTVVPVTKGNGYGFGNAVLAAEAASLGAVTLAVGTYDEVDAVAGAFPGDLLVLTPWRPWMGVHVAGSPADRLIHTVSRLEDLRILSETGTRPRVVVEILTGMRRHGIEPDQIAAAAELLPGVEFEGFALHLPLNGAHGEEARTLGARALAATEAVGERRRTLWVSHLPPVDAAAIANRLSAEVRLRVATAMWLGDRGALQARGTVLDVHQVRRGQRFGYRQRRAVRDGSLLVVAGGTAHGIALEAPAPAAGARQRAVSLAKGALEAAGRALSPFHVAGKQRWFAEPPHMQCSMVWLPADVPPPTVGDELDVDVRFTTTSFDRIAWKS